MSRDIKTIEALVDRCKLDMPVPSEVRTRFSMSKEENLKKILKKTGGYSVLFGTILSVFYFVKKFGISLSVIKSAIIFWTAAALATVTITFGVYYSGKYIKDKIDKHRYELEQKEEIIRLPEREAKNNPVNKKKRSFAKDDVTGEKKIQLPLDLLREKGLPIELFHLLDGTKIAGSVLLQDERTVKIDTGDDVVTISKEDIIRRLPMD